MSALASPEALILLGGGLLLLGVLSSIVAFRFGAPLLLVFLLLGMAAGEDGPGGIVFNDFDLAYLVGSVALAIILFDGGLRTRVTTFRGVLAPSVVLATVGVLITAGVTGVATMWLFDLDVLPSLLLGSIVASTDAAAVFLLLRAGGLQLRRRAGTTLEIESATNDPMAVFLTFALVSALAAPENASVLQLVGHFLQQASIGSLAGLAGGFAICALINRVDLADGLHPILVVAAALLVFAAAALVGGSGYLAVFVAGLVVGNRPVRAYAGIVNFHDTATWLCQIVMFLMLGLLATPSRLATVALPAVTVAAFLILVARPLAVWACLAPFGYDRREIALVGWVGLRGAVSIFLATVPILAGIPGGIAFFDVAFFVVLVSLLVQGWTIGLAARRLGLALPRRTFPVHRVELDLPGQLREELVGYHLLPGSPLLAQRRIPAWAKPVLVVRQGTTLNPAEAGPMQADDYIYLLAPPERAQRLDRLFAAEPGEAAMLTEFPLDASARLADLADVYGLPVTAAEAGLTLAELFASRFEGQPQPGDRLELGEAALVVREIDEERVLRVGLLPEGTPVVAKWRRRLARRRLGRWMLQQLGPPPAD
jgi:cell volume regulation protein A